MLTAAHRKFKFDFPLTLVQPGTGALAIAPPSLRAVKKDNLLSSQIFPINFRYLQQAMQMKVLKVVYGSGEPIYKIVWNSALSQWGNSCWLQRRLENWVVLLGPDPDEKLKSAITAAIELEELTT
jgi:hypothetical protein